MLSRAERAVLNNALEKYRPGHAKPILIGGQSQLKPALRLMTAFRLVIRDVTEGAVTTSYTRWIDSVQVRELEILEVYVTLSPHFERTWLEVRKRLPVHGAEAGQYGAPEPVSAPALQLGKKVRRERIPNHFSRGAPTRVWPGVDQGRGGKCH